MRSYLLLSRDFKQALREDYDFFVSGDFESYIPEEIRAMVKAQNDKFVKRHINIEEAEVFNKEDIEYRKAIRRIYIMFGLSKNSVYDDVYDEIFGDGFNMYVKLLNGDASKRDRRDFEKNIIDALYIEMTGTQAKDNDFIPLTIRRNDGKYQKAMIMVGRVKKDDIKLRVSVPKTVINEDAKNTIELIIGNGEKRFRLSMPLVMYFEKIASGAVFVSADPVLTHGISKLEAMLSEYGVNKDITEMQILLNKTDNPTYIKVDLDEDKVYFD